MYNGVPAGCFYTGTVDGWNTTCAEGLLIESQQYWVSTAEAMYPGYTGSYPRMLLYHGTADTTLSWPNYGEEVKQWSGLLGYDTTADETYDNDPASPYTMYVYGADLVGIVGTGVGHTVPVHEEQDLEWFEYIVSGAPG